MKFNEFQSCWSCAYSISVMLIIYMKPGTVTAVVTEGLASFAVETSSYTFRCKDMKSVTVTWYKDETERIGTAKNGVSGCTFGGDQALYTGTCDTDTSVTLTITTVLSSMHGSQWTCKDGSGKDHISNPVTLNVNVPVKSVQLNAPQLSIKENTKVTFTCVSGPGSRPEAVIKWFRQSATGQPVEIKENQTLITKTISNDMIQAHSTLTFYPTRTDKNVTCRAKNDLNSKWIEPSSPATLSVYYPPGNVLFTPRTSVHQKHENDTLPNISCSASCLPACRYEWRRDSRTGARVSTSGQLNLGRMTDQIIGTYICIASNSQYTETAEKQLRIDLLLPGQKADQSEPADDSTGLIVGVVVGVLLVIVAVVVTVICLLKRRTKKTADGKATSGQESEIDPRQVYSEVNKPKKTAAKTSPTAGQATSGQESGIDPQQLYSEVNKTKQPAAKTSATVVTYEPVSKDNVNQDGLKYPELYFGTNGTNTAGQPNVEAAYVPTPYADIDFNKHADPGPIYSD